MPSLEEKSDRTFSRKFPKLRVYSFPLRRNISASDKVQQQRTFPATESATLTIIQEQSLPSNTTSSTLTTTGCSGLNYAGKPMNGQ